jgi:hypothetical protein
MNKPVSVRRFVLPGLLAVTLIGWSSVASAGLHSRLPMVTAPRQAAPLYVAPRGLVPTASHQASNGAPVMHASHASHALPSGQNAASKSAGIPR